MKMSCKPTCVPPRGRSAPSRQFDFRASDGFARVIFFLGRSRGSRQDHVTLSPITDPSDQPAPADYEQFIPLLEKDETICGRFKEAKLEYLFGSKSRWVQSTALVPLGAKGSLGMMAIGSSDQNRFYPGMGTLFLDLLADTITARLTLEQPEEQRLSA